MGFRSLQHIQESKVHFSRVLPTRYVPPSGFGYPLDGLLPSIPRRFCFVPAALLGFALRSVLLPSVAESFPASTAPPTVTIKVEPVDTRQAGPMMLGCWGHFPPGIPGRRVRG